MSEADVQAIDPHLRTFLNLNTPDELAQAEEIARQVD
jgi:molybdopterin-guanine dinucleotide biosynthesis protein A